MIKKTEMSYSGMSKDLARDKQSDKYFDARNIRIIATNEKSSFAMTNEEGNELIFTIPIPSVNTNDSRIEYTVGAETKYLPYATTGSVIPRCQIEEVYQGLTSGTQVIIGTKDIRDSAIIITTDSQGFDCFWELKGIIDGNMQLDLLYMNNLGLSKENLIQILYNYENTAIQKIYFVDGFHQLRLMNIRQSIDSGDAVNLVDVNASIIDSVSDFTLSQVQVNGVNSGGGHTSGMIQYSYGLYVLNGAQTTPAPLCPLVPIDKGEALGGGALNENLGKSVSLTINDIDTKFTHIKIYAIKYTSYNESPEVTIVADREIDSYTSFNHIDTGKPLEIITVEEFLFLGSSPIRPKHIEAKDGRLFPINITEIEFDVDLDCKAFSFSSIGDGATAKVLDAVFLDSNEAVQGTPAFVSAPDFILPDKHDGINADYETYKYQQDGVTLGASGKYLEVEFLQTPLTMEEGQDLQVFKDREIYRLGIKFFNGRGQSSLPNWVMDFVAPTGNLDGLYNQLKVTLTPEFYVWLNDSTNFPTDDDKPIGYRILRADRTLTDQTIFGQGFINPMLANKASSNKATGLNERRRIVNSSNSNKMPSLIRMFENASPIKACQDYRQLYDGSPYNQNEVYQSRTRDDYKAQTFQHNRLMQFFSPEVLFREAQLDAGYKLRVLGLVEQTEINNWTTETHSVAGNTVTEAKFLGGLSWWQSQTWQIFSGEVMGFHDFAFWGPANADWLIVTNQIYRQFAGTYHKNTADIIDYEIYGSPEITERGADYKDYNNDNTLKYCNNMRTMLQDDFRNSDHVNNDAEVQVLGANTDGARCVTFAEGPDSPLFPVESRRSIEDIWAETGIPQTNGVLLTEFVQPEYNKYIGNMYGGMTNEAKSNTSYIEIGGYNSVDVNELTIESPGDTFVNMFTFTKMVKGDKDLKDQAYNIMNEIVSIKVESTIDLKNRNDLSINPWDNNWQPRWDEYQDYNKVYSQQPNLIKTSDIGIKFKKIKEFDTRIMASKVKIPGEFVDNWTDFLENETMDIDGKYGPINATSNLNDEIFCLQDTAVAHISINPRVQIGGSDGVPLELGTGGILHDYSYKSSVVGTVNKWGVITTENAFYFIDPITKGIMTFDGKGIARLTDLKGFHHEMINNIDFNQLSLDNPVLGTGISCGYNPANADVMFTFLQGNNNFTLAFNEKIGEFTSYYDYTPAWYINKGDTMITTNPNTTEVWDHFKGKPNHFYGQHYKSSITFGIAPAGDEIILNNASYKLELKDPDGVELPNEGLTGVRVYNDYQDSGLAELIMRTNVFKKFRNWKINFPRNKGGRDRVRSAWGFAEFSFDNENGNRLILHDITLYYTQH